MDGVAILGNVLTVVFGITAIVLALRLRRKKQPVWSSATRKIIGLGGSAPQEVKLTFNDEEVTDVYQTLAVFFNRGSKPIRREDVARPIALDLCHGRLLRNPRLLAISREENEFTASHAGDGRVELAFKYLGRHDGACVEMLHTGGERLTASGTIIDAEIAKVEGFTRCLRTPDARRWAVLFVFAAPLGLLALILVRPFGDSGLGLMDWIGVSVVSLYSLLMFREYVYPLWIQRLGYPSWCRDIRSTSARTEAGELSAD